VSGVVLAVDHVTKDFPGLRALDDVSLRVHAGEIVALLGQNGSGKSTLVKILAGVYTADAGSATHGSLHFIHQDLGLIHELSTVENLALGGPAGLGPVRRGAERDRARRLIGRFGVDFDVLAPVGELTPAQRTIVAIARAMDGWTSGEHVLVLDEPTASLHRGEVGVLFAAVREVARAGAGVVFISHRLDEVTALADRVLVLRDGRLVEDVPAAGLTAAALASLITGKAAPSGGAAPDGHRPGAEPLLKVRGLAGGALRELDFDLCRGEVLGVAGSLGSGREQVAGLVFGSRARQGDVQVEGWSVRPSPQDSLEHGVALVPADRRSDGGVMTMSVRENLTLPDLARFGSLWLNRRAERAAAAEWCGRVGLRPMRPERELGLFSGGNQQKAVLARWLRIAPAVLLVEEPTQGVDIGAGEAIRQLILDAAGAGAAVLVSTSDNADLIRMCSRVLVLRDGVLATELIGPAVNDHRLTEECLGATTRETENV